MQQKQKQKQQLCAVRCVRYHLLNFIEFFIELRFVVFRWNTSESTWVVDCCSFFFLFRFYFIPFFIGFYIIFIFSFPVWIELEWNFQQMEIDLLTNNINWIQFQLNYKHKTHLWMKDETNEPKWNSIGDGTSSMHKWNQNKITEIHKIEWYVSTINVIHTFREEERKEFYKIWIVA